MSNYYADMAHVIRVVESCNTKGQFKIAQKMAKAFRRKWPKRKISRVCLEEAPRFFFDELVVAMDLKICHLDVRENSKWG